MKNHIQERKINKEERELNIKRYEEVKYKANKLDTDIKRAFKVLSKVSIGMTIISLIISIACMKLSLENEALKLENEDLRTGIEVLSHSIETKESMIADLQEDNIKLQEMIK